VAGLSDQALTGGALAVTGGVYDLAQPDHAAALALGNVRVGTQRNLAVTNRLLTEAAYQDSLAVTATAANVRLGVVAPGSTLLAGDAANVVVTAAAAGSLADSLALGFVSNANGVAGLDNASLAAGAVTVTGAAYDLALPSLAATSLTLGNVRVGATGSVALTNAVVSAAGFQDSLDTAVLGAPARLAVATPANLLASATGNVVVTAAAAGSLAGSVSLGYVSNANGVTGLANENLAAGSLAVTGVAYDYARGIVAAGQSLGNVRVGATAAVAVTNATVSDAALSPRTARPTTPSIG
jgi:hypothetical protein